MPFNIDLQKLQKAELWTFKRTPEALELQSFIDNDDRQGYVNRLKELSLPEGGGHKFSRTMGQVYELFDENESMQVPIKLQIKNSVITWYFIAPTDRTKQTFRDEIFNTAALAHASVKDSCETYYRGTNHLHIRTMHTHEAEAEFNHNHYRTESGGPITPVELYEHLFAFQAQAQGKKFIPTTEERDEIILKYGVFWADYNFDINYVALSAMKTEGQSSRIISQLVDIAKAGKLSPNAADEQLEVFFASEHGKNMFKLAEKFGFPKAGKDRDELKSFIKENYRTIYSKVAPQKMLSEMEDISMEPFDTTTPSTSKSSSAKSSPREMYLTEPDQLLDEIDTQEYETFAADLTKHCHSIDKHILQHLEFEDFRAGLLLYHALRTLQAEMGLDPSKDMRFHSDLMTDDVLKKMIKELPSLQKGSTEDDIGTPLINKLLGWIKNAPPELENWIAWVRVNGARGLGAELGRVRETAGAVDIRQAIPMSDRGGKVAEIDFDKVDLKKLFLPGGNTPISSESESIKKLVVKFNEELSKLTRNQISGHGLDDAVFKSKVNVIQTCLAALSNKANISAVTKALADNKNWDLASSPTNLSRLADCVHEFLSLAEKTYPLGASSSSSPFEPK